MHLVIQPEVFANIVKLGLIEGNHRNLTPHEIQDFSEYVDIVLSDSLEIFTNVSKTKLMCYWGDAFKDNDISTKELEESIPDYISKKVVDTIKLYAGKYVTGALCK